MSLSSLFRSKEEVAKEAKDYFEQLFPFGETQRDNIKKAIHSFFPNHSDSNLFFTYIVMKEMIIKGFDDIRTQKELDTVKPALSENDKETLNKILNYDLKLDSLASIEDYLNL